MIDLPPDTLDVLANHLAGTHAPNGAVDWADRLTTAGVDHPAIVELALANPDDWQSVAKLTAPALQAVGVRTDASEGFARLRELLIDRLLDEAFDVHETAMQGFRMSWKLDHRGALAAFHGLEDYLALLRDGVIVDDDAVRLGMRRWAVAYVERQVSGPFDTLSAR